MTIVKFKFLLTMLLLSLSYSSCSTAAAMDFEDETFSEQPLTGTMMDLEFAQQAATDTEKTQPSVKVNSKTGQSGDQKPTDPIEKSSALPPAPALINQQADSSPLIPTIQNPDQPTTKAKTNNVDTKKLVKEGLESLSEVVDEDILDTSLEKALELKSGLNQLNAEINQKIDATIENSVILQNLTAKDNVLNFEQQYSSRQTATTELMKLQAASSYAEIEPEGFMGFLSQLPGYIFNVKNLAILAVAIIFLGWLLRAIRFIANRIY
jgi:hypothetical protein